MNKVSCLVLMSLIFVKCSPPSADKAKEEIIDTSLSEISSASGAHNICVWGKNLPSQIYCWGQIDHGIMGGGASDVEFGLIYGDQVNESQEALKQIDLGTNFFIQDVALFEKGACALNTEGKIKCWGSNGSGQLGLGDVNHRGDEDGEMGDNLPFVDIGTNVKAKKIVAGGTHVCALTDAGQAKCWGSNSSGQLGLGDANSRGNESGEMGDNLSNVSVGSSSQKVLDIYAGHVVSCLKLEDQEVYCFGYRGMSAGNQSTNMGDSAQEMQDLVPLSLGSPITKLALGGAVSCALLENGEVKCWGEASNGALGNGSGSGVIGDSAGEVSPSLAAVNLGTFGTVTHMAAGYRFVCVQNINAQVRCWGSNSTGQLGRGDSNTIGDNAGEMGDNLPNVDLGPDFVVQNIHSGSPTMCASQKVPYEGLKLKCWGAGGTGLLLNETGESAGTDASHMGAGLPLLSFSNQP